LSALAYRIDPAARTVEAIRFSGVRDLYANVGTDDLDHATMRRSDGGILCTGSTVRAITSRALAGSGSTVSRTRSPGSR
jgi:hypothetical protein